MTLPRRLYLFPLRYLHHPDQPVPVEGTTRSQAQGRGLENLRFTSWGGWLIRFRSLILHLHHPTLTLLAQRLRQGE